MIKIFVNHWITDFIESHARSSPHEIYGYLIGFETIQGNLNIISAITCERYIQQHYTHAHPDPNEITEIGSALPQGIGIIGIYHSHPDEVFHSNTDDQTLLNNTRLYSKMVSAVTNGKITKWYQLTSEKKSIEIKIINQKISMKNYKFLVINGHFVFNIPVNVTKPIIPQISTKTINEFFNEWENCEIELFKNKIISNLIDNEKNPSILNTEEFFLRDIEKSFLKYAFEDFFSSNISDLMKDETIIKINIQTPKINIIDEGNLENPENSGNDSEIKIQGNIPLIGIILLNKDSKNQDLNNIMEKIKSELFDDIKFKISRGILKFQNKNQLEIVVPQTILLSYPKIMLKIKIWLDKINSFPVEYEKTIAENLSSLKNLEITKLPNISTFIEKDNSMLESFYKRILALTRMDKKKFGVSLLEVIANIYTIRGQDKQNQTLQNVLTLLSKIKK